MSRCQMHAFSLLLWLLNGITFSQACPAVCTCTGVKVDCYGRDLVEIPADIPLNVVHLDLQNNHISSLNVTRLQNLSNLQDFLLRYNNLQALPDGAFSNLRSLRHLQLGNNQLTSLNKDAFANLPNLTILEVNDNQLTSIDGAFDNIPSLTRLILSRNALTNLTDSDLAPLTHIVYLMLSENKISYISPTSFYTLKDLSYLTLRDNPLRNIDNILSQNTQMAYLDLANCSLQAIPQGLPWTTRYLQLAQNNITKIAKDSFQKIHYLGILILDENQISQIEPGALLLLTYLHQLWLNGNSLDRFPSPIPPSVNTLCIDKNFIQNITNHDFPSHSKLQLLSLKGNKITSLEPYNFANLGLLQKLYLSSNSIAQLKNRAFLGLRNLTILDIGRNPITHIETRFAAGLQNLQELDLSFVEDTEPILQGNFLRDIPHVTNLDLRFSPSLAKNIMGSVETVKSLYNLQTLNLMDNQLQTLELDLPRFFPHLHTIKLSGNPWRCDQQLVWLHDWIQRQRNLFADAQDIVCFSPSHLRGRAVADLPVTAFFYTTVSTTTSMKTTEGHSSEGLEVAGSGDNLTEPFLTLPLTTASQMQSSDLAQTEPTASLMSSSLSTGDLDTQVSLAQQSFTSPTTEFSTPPGQASIATFVSSSSSPSFVSDTDSTIITFTTSKTVHPAQSPTATVTTSTGIKTASVKLSTFSVTFSKHQSTPVPTTDQTDERSSEPQTTAETSVNSSFSSKTSTLQRTTSSITAAKKELQTSHPASQTDFTNKTQPAETSTVKTPASTTKAANTSTHTAISTTGTTNLTTATTPTVASTSMITNSNNTEQETQQSTLLSVTASSAQPRTASSTAQPRTMEPSVPHTDQTTSSSKKAATPQKQLTSPENSITVSLSTPTEISGVSTQSEQTPNPTTSISSSIAPSSTSTFQIDPRSTNIPQIRPKGSRLPSLSEASSNTRMIITATSVTILCLIIVLLLAAFLKRHRGQIKRLYHHAMSYTIETGDTAFVLSDQDDPDMISERQPLGQRPRSERGSNGSRQSMDTSQESDTAINGFAWTKLE